MASERQCNACYSAPADLCVGCSERDAGDEYERGKSTLAAENAQLRQQLEEAQKQAQHYMDLGLVVDADRADLRARLQTVEKMLEEERSKR